MNHQVFERKWHLGAFSAEVNLVQTRSNIPPLTSGPSDLLVGANWVVASAAALRS